MVLTPINSPDWVHLLSAGEISTGDNHRPYRVQDTDTLQGAAEGETISAGLCKWAERSEIAGLDRGAGFDLDASTMSTSRMSRSRK